MTELKYLGHIITSENKVHTIKDILLPKTIREIKSFLGICSYYQKYIHDLTRKTYHLRERSKDTGDNRQGTKRI
jgi:hypothetical protein